MAYGLKYQGEFDSIAENGYRLEILKKDYTGLFYSLPMAAVPVVQNWGTDEIKPAIKACNLTINYLNLGSIPIESFYSNNDDEFKVIFYQGAVVLFVGFLVQDDIREPMVNYTHEVQLSASDNLGLLKDIPFDKYPLTSYVPITAQGDQIGTQNWIYIRNSAYVPVVGTSFRISGHPIATMNRAFTPTVVNVISAGNYDVRTNTFTGDTTAEPSNINGVGGTFDFYERTSLLNVIALCLQNTGLGLSTYIYKNLYELRHNTASVSLGQTYINLQSFISGEDFLNCFDVLTKICDRFHLTLFQSLGRWNIIRWDELRINPGINGFIYDENFILTGTTTLNAQLDLGWLRYTYPITGLTKSAVRPFEFTKETFNYNFPKYLLQNYDLQRVGALIREYMNGTTRISEYVAIAWLGASATTNPYTERFIRIEYDTILLRESNRYLVLKGDRAGTLSKTIECNIGDRVAFACSFRTNVSQEPPLTYAFVIQLSDGTSFRNFGGSLGGVSRWITSSGYFFTLPAGENMNQWHSIDTGASPPMPFSGLLTIFLIQLTLAPQNVSKETHYKDMRFEYTAYINNTVKIIGHIHKDIQPVNIKNNEDLKISIDDSPRNAIEGTLFRNRMTGVVQQRTELWNRAGVVESKKLGEITTREQLQWRSNVRTRLDGSFRFIKPQGTNISMLNHFIYSELPGLNFLFGSLELDYRNDKLTCTATELFKDGEAAVTETYSFTYIYDAK